MKTYERNNKRNKGSLLIEAMLAVVILSVCITLVIRSLSSSLRATVASTGYVTAMALLENKMFDLLQKGFIGPGRFEEQAFASPFESYKYKLKTEVLRDSNQKKLNIVKLGVSWSSKSRKNNIEVETYLFNPPE